MAQRISEMSPEAIRAAVTAEYGRVVSAPASTLPFPVGRAFAESVGYSRKTLDGLPTPAVAAFAGISHPLAHADLRPGETVLDLGCGAGLDTILMARQVGPHGHVHSLDLSPELIEAARCNVAAAGVNNVSFHEAPAEAIPLPDRAVEAVIVNGLLNLCPSKEHALTEVYRVLRPGGRALISEIVLAMPEPGREADWVGASCPTLDPALTLEKWFQ